MPPHVQNFVTQPYVSLTFYIQYVGSEKAVSCFEKIGPKNIIKNIFMTARSKLETILSRSLLYGIKKPNKIRVFMTPTDSDNDVTLVFNNEQLNRYHQYMGS